MFAGIRTNFISNLIISLNSVFAAYFGILLLGLVLSIVIIFVLSVFKDVNRSISQITGNRSCIMLV